MKTRRWSRQGAVTHTACIPLCRGTCGFAVISRQRLQTRESKSVSIGKLKIVQSLHISDHYSARITFASGTSRCRTASLWVLLQAPTSVFQPIPWGQQLRAHPAQWSCQRPCRQTDTRTPTHMAAAHPAALLAPFSGPAQAKPLGFCRQPLQT